MIEPAVFKNVIAVPPTLLAWAEKEHRTTYEEWGFDDSLTFAGKMGGQFGPVAPHIDADVPSQHCVWGLVLVSEGHRLITSGFEADLSAGDLYRLDPLDYHGTDTAVPDGRIIFAALDRPAAGDALSEAEIAAAIVESCEAEIALLAARATAYTLAG
ncbi:hypothetical protein [Sphingosinicella sp. BN140058]|uniref:hypothetical protein n=1 Tax=Sphingosinicella sp. BN140058 TaxID=1892855 RepID=UPI0010114FE4|nr:hypothetical protein [Sphingosinicella sp. BN140058]QAY80121.1 hypothetical protein ETR14_26120 [Sphingosinicella sp. BN140058]